jgi:site-specific DNA-methyltransferase (adenine-specific)
VPHPFALFAKGWDRTLIADRCTLYANPVPPKNQLYYGDNFDVLQRYVREESVDLVYLDPPFNSRQDYNVLFAEKDGSKSSSQIHAFEDTWEWNYDAERSYEYIVETIGGRIADAMRAFRTFLGNSIPDALMRAAF